MAERTDTNLEGTDSVTNDTPTFATVKAWFGREILPLEASLMQYLQHNWRNASDIADLRQEVYAQVYQAALRKFPDKPKQYLFTTARNLLSRRVQHERLVPIEAVADLDALDAASDTPGPDRVAVARDELRHLQAALDGLPPRVRQAVVLGKIEGMSRAEIAARMDISEAPVAQYLTEGIRTLIDDFYGEPPALRRVP
jgi:RNA polymerase sigma-70 factor (ECF subfamily)